jgi:SAM-dependent methyltransferase
MAGEFKAFEHAGWNGIPGDYHDGFGGLTTQAVGPLLDAARVVRGAEVLDVASGPGYVSGAAAARGAKVIGVDFAAAMVEDARRRFAGIDFREGDAEALPFQAASFDAVVMNFGVLHLEDPDRALAEALRVLRPGGRLAFTVWAAPDQALAFGIVLGAIQKHGDMKVPLPPGPPFFRFGDPAESVATLSRTGFADARAQVVAQRWRLRSGEALFDVMLRGTVRTGGLLRAQQPAALDAIRREVTEAAAAHRAGDGIELPMPAILSSAQKPG